jgi:hypothetical protein
VADDRRIGRLRARHLSLLARGQKRSRTAVAMIERQIGGNMNDPFTDTRDPLVKTMARSAMQASVEKAVAAERERCAKLVPTNWCDPLLTGPDAPKTPLDCRGVEQLLRGIQDRIRANG